MCGGVAVSRRGSICGMIEGIVPNDHPHEILRNLGVIIEAKDILRYQVFLHFLPHHILRLAF